MSLLFRESQRREATLDALLATRGLSTRAGAASVVGPKKALKHSVVWGATRLRADLVSLMPVDVYRKVGRVGVEVPKPGVLVAPSSVAEGHPMGIGEWMYSSQTALDRTGNSVGIIRETDALGKPARIDLVDPDEVSFRCKGGRIVEYRVSGELVDAKYIWHERQFTVAGIPFGLSPIAAAALSLTAGLSAQEWAVAWFENGANPSAHLKNEAKVLAAGEAERIKRATASRSPRARRSCPARTGRTPRWLRRPRSRSSSSRCTTRTRTCAASWACRRTWWTWCRTRAGQSRTRTSRSATCSSS